MASSKIEDYLKAIYELEKETGIARTTKLAGMLKISAATVSETIKRLSTEQPRLIDYKQHAGVRLTPAGRKRALNVIRRHRLVETFLNRTLGLSWDEVHDEAEILEHHLSQRLTEAIDRHLGYPRFDPHGEPIPDEAGNLVDQAESRLSDLEENDRFRIVRVDPRSSEVLVYLHDSDIGIHSSGRVVSKSPPNGTITVAIQDKGRAHTHTLGREVADQIFIEML
jgi:DtxR family Mn-dependent transcriptional regulator